MNRTPPAAVRRQLRAEVGYGCPLPACGNPYLAYHHYDPPWAVQEHHNPAGMIALCGEHHRKADAGAFAIEQLRELKSRKADTVSGRFDWRRNQILAVVGGNLYFETPRMVVFRDDPVIWFDRDEDGTLLLNLCMLTTSNEQRLALDANDWLLLGSPSDFVCPPSGKGIFAAYSNGDRVNVEFLSLEDSAEARNQYSSFPPDVWTDIPFPVTAVELQMVVGGTNLAFGPNFTQIGGVHMKGTVMMNCAVGLSIS